MKDINKMRLGVLRSIKELRTFIDSIESGVKSRQPDKIYPAYIFLKTLCYHMDKGDLTPFSIELYQELLHNHEKKESQNEARKQDQILTNPV